MKTRHISHAISDRSRRWRRDIDLSVDGGASWLATPLATDVRNTGETEVTLPSIGVPTEHARLRVRCDWRPFFAVSPGDFTVLPGP